MKVDLESAEFKEALEKTRKFANSVCDKMDYYPNPVEQENERIYIGLTRNKLIHGKRYCPCFMVLGKTAEEKKEAEDNRICPCKIAINDEIPNDGKCHCGIFCSKESVNNFKKTKQEEEMTTPNEDLLQLLQKEEINGTELAALLEARNNKKINFVLVDVREQSEFDTEHIVGVDYLLPTSDFYKKAQTLEQHKEDIIISQCHAGGRSYQVQQALQSMGYKNVINLAGGISKYTGETI